MRQAVSAYAKKTKQSFQVAIKKIAKRLFDDIVKRTPFKNGYAKAGWVLGVGSLNYPYSYGNGSDRTNWPKTDEDGSLPKAQAELELQNYKIGDGIFIRNRVPYITKLDIEGYSSHAPDGIIRPALQDIRDQMQAEIKAARREVGLK